MRQEYSIFSDIIIFLPGHFSQRLIQELTEMRVGNPGNVLENSFPQRWHNIDILIIQLLDFEESINNIKSSTTEKKKIISKYFLDIDKK